MKKILVIVLIIVCLVFSIYKLFAKDDLSNDRAIKDKDGRYLIIVNETKQVINEVRVTIDNGTEVDKMKKEDIDKKSFPIEIPKGYADYNDFTVTLVDRYDTEYQKKVSNVPKKGHVEVTITKDDVIKETDSLKNKINRFFNGD